MSKPASSGAPAGVQPQSDIPAFQIESFGEAALIVILGTTIDEARYRQLAALAKAIKHEPPAGFSELVPAYNSLLVLFDPLLTDTETMKAALSTLAAAMDPVAADSERDILELPVAYGGEYGPDLESVAAHTGLNARELVDLHSGRPYLVYMLGFTPGFPYLGGMDPRLAAPRLKTPRTKVPSGSVGIADTQTGVYPLESPGGWNLIGRTPLDLFDPGRRNPALLAPGKYVRFVPISAEDFESLRLPKVDKVGIPDPAIAPASIGGTRTLTVIKPGALSTVQDAGRFGYQDNGVPPSGPMDEYSMGLANILAGNEPGTACIECTLGGLELRFDAACVFSLAGADTPAYLNDQAVPMHARLRAGPGESLRLGLARAGLRVYLAVHGGIAVPAVMGSRATFGRGGFGGLEGRALAAGDRLPLSQISDLAGPDSGVPAPRVPPSLLPVFAPEIRVRAIRTHEAERFTQAGLESFFSASYTVSPKSDRMGCRLEGPVIEHRAGADIISSGVLTGTVQVPGDGQPIVLMAERQTTGGYTRIAQVIRADLPLLGQARPGDRVRFVECAPAEATQALVQRAAVLRQLAETPPESTKASARHFRVWVDGTAYEVGLEEAD